MSTVGWAWGDREAGKPGSLQVHVRTGSGKPRLREGKSLVQDHTASERRSWDSNQDPDSIAPALWFEGCWEIQLPQSLSPDTPS